MAKSTNSSGGSKRKPSPKKRNPAANKATAGAKPVAATPTSAKASAPEVAADAKSTAKPTTAPADAVRSASVAKETVKSTDAGTEPKADAKAAPKTEMPNVARSKDPIAKPAAVTQPPAEPERRGIFLPLLLGGVVAGGIGFAVNEYDLLGRRGDDGVAQLRSQLETQSTTLTAQADRIAQIEAAETPAPDLSGLDQIQTEVTALNTTLDAIDARLTLVEKQPIAEGGTSQAAIEAYQRELEALQASVADQRAEIEGMLDNALSVEAATKQAAQTTAAQAALIDIKSAIDAGQPYEAALAALSDALEGPAPEALAMAAQSGVPTLASLQADFPIAARNALSAARSDGEDAGQDGLGGFLKRQLGARSVAPREGDDPDAVLSRAEQAVKEGRLSDALTEMEALPDGAKTAMADWQAAAQSRAAVLGATDELGDSLTAN